MSEGLLSTKITQAQEISGSLY